MRTSVDPAPPPEQYWLDRRWIHEHYAQLVADYPNQWIAVHAGRVIASGLDLGQVEDAATTIGDSGTFVFQFIDDGSLIF